MGGGGGGRGVWFGVAAGCAAAACVIAAALVSRRVKSHRRWQRAAELVAEFEEGCATSVGRLKQVVDAMVVEMHAGLASDGGSKLKMLLTYVDSLPDGSEEGIFYALDLGGTNFRVLQVQLGGKGSNILKQKVERQPIPQELMISTCEKMFGFIASKLKQFVEREEGLQEGSHKTRALGFTFSFPVRQNSVSSGVLIKWTKGFDIEDIAEKDIVECLQEALTKEGLSMQVAVLVNDTVGTLALGHYHDQDTVAAVIIGTGTNACYVERPDAIIKYQGLLTNYGGMVINMEWGNFWTSHLPRTSYDIDLDEDSPNPTDQGFEKLISGMYLGEITRRVLSRVAVESEVFGDVSDKLSQPFALSTPLMATMHEDDSADLREVKRIFEQILQIPDIPLKTRRLVVKVCDIVTRRAARLVASGIVGILKKIGRDGSAPSTSGHLRAQSKRSVVAVEGGLYEGYALFRDYVDEAIVEILGEELAQNIFLKSTADGSGTGAALLAAAHLSNRKGYI
ncbi:hexokinase-3-like protein [Carex littledalei]|uniref:Phosphotransferase n=1 Tax=Carex littledalei TaxID=544730 RepID=A0A833RJ68_9POAL|nr:hexokinase-3-like protein [Carex littledalei]